MIYMIDSIRRQQIDEVLQYDRNMNLQALNLEKSGVAKMHESTDLSPLLKTRRSYKARTHWSTAS